MARIRLDRKKRQIIVDGVDRLLPDKSFEVLLMLIDKAPQEVTRQAFIDALWSGRQSTGEKGLSQALWQIRSALGDNVSNPRFVRTIPRVGYQWVGPLDFTKAGICYRWGRSVAAMFVVFTIASGSFFLSERQFQEPYVGAATFMEHGRLVVRMTKGCMLYIQPAADKALSSPILSRDGMSVAFRVRQGGECRLATVQFNGLNQQDYGVCPDVVPATGI